jgi:hypothetical protein
MLSPIDILIIPYEFLQRTTLNLVTTLIDFRNNLKVSICYKTIFHKFIQQGCNLFNHFCFVIDHLPFESLLVLYDDGLTI